MSLFWSFKDLQNCPLVFINKHQRTDSEVHDVHLARAKLNALRAAACRLPAGDSHHTAPWPVNQ